MAPIEDPAGYNSSILANEPERTYEEPVKNAARAIGNLSFRNLRFSPGGSSATIRPPRFRSIDFSPWR